MCACVDIHYRTLGWGFVCVMFVVKYKLIRGFRDGCSFPWTLKVKISATHKIQSLVFACLLRTSHSDSYKTSDLFTLLYRRKYLTKSLIQNIKKHYWPQFLICTRSLLSGQTEKRKRKEREERWEESDTHVRHLHLLTENSAAILAEINKTRVLGKMPLYWNTDDLMIFTTPPLI